MATVITRAIYTGGVLKPTTHLNLPEGAAVEVEIRAVREAPAADIEALKQLPRDELVALARLAKGSLKAEGENAATLVRRLRDEWDD